MNNVIKWPGGKAKLHVDSIVLDRGGHPSARYSQCMGV